MIPIERVRHPHATRHKKKADETRNFLVDYFNSENGSVSWQEKFYDTLY